MQLTQQDKEAIEKIQTLARERGLRIKGGKVRRTSSRFCFGVEHGDYNGTELFGVGTDRFIWMAYNPNGTEKVRLFSANFPDDGVIEYEIRNVPKPKSPEIAETWGRFPFGVDFILNRERYLLNQGIDGVIYGNIPGGGMSRSASLSLNLLLSMFDSNGIEVGDNHEQKLKVVDLAQAVENDYIGSPCGKLDQAMILFSKEGQGTHFNQHTGEVEYIPYSGEDDFRIVVMDTGTDRPGLEKSTYAMRRKECETLVELLQKTFNLQIGGKLIQCLADVKVDEDYNSIMQMSLPESLWGYNELQVTETRREKTSATSLKKRLDYIFHAQQRFYKMMEAWKSGDIKAVGEIFSQDGVGLKNIYQISGPELETMVDIAHSVEGVLGARMLGGGDKGASGAIVEPDAVERLKKAINLGYPRSHPDFADKYDVHVVSPTQGVRVFEGVLN